MILTPMAFAHRWGDPLTWRDVLQALVSFSLLASSVYVMNDADDVESDRAHPSKRKRPFASGELDLKHAPWICGGLALAGYGTALGLPVSFVMLLVLYSAANVLYSKRIKRVPGLDVLFLTAMFLIRILAGGAATAIPVSSWLLAFSFCFFLSLATLKRAQELLISHPTPSDDTQNSRGYRRQDLKWITWAGPGSSLISLLILAGYIQVGETARMYASPRLLWGVVLLITVWILRVWRLTLRGEMNDDPVLFAVRDPWSYATGLLSLILIQVAYTGI